MKSALLITNIFPPLIGGPATFIDRTAAYLAEHGTRVTVICSSLEPTDSSDAGRKFKVLRVPLRNRIRYELTLRKHLMVQLLKHRTILVNGLESQTYSVAKALGRPYVIKIVGDTVWETARNQGRTCLNIDDFQVDAKSQSEWRPQVLARNAYVLGASKVVTPSAYLRRMVIGWGVPPERAVVVENGVELDAVQNHAPLARSPGEPLQILYVGRLSNWKGVETLLLAAVGLQGVQISIVGDGPAWPALVELKQQLGLGDEVRFTGRVPVAAARDFMTRSHLLVLTSLYEGLSHTLLEACAAGLPSIASDCGGNNEVIQHLQSGLLIPPQDVAALRGTILTIRDDERLRRSLSAGALDRSTQFNLTKTVTRYREELLR